MMASATVDLPQPDSPTMPTASPGIDREVEVDDGRDLARRACSRRSRGSCTRGSAAVGHGAQSLSEISRRPSASRLRPSTSEEMASAGHSMALARRSRRSRARLGDHLAPVGIGRRQAEAQEAERGDGDRDIAEAQAGIDDQRPARIGQQLDEHDVASGVSPRISAAEM